MEIPLNDSPQSAEPRTEKRRSTRVVQAVPIIVKGCDALRNEFEESTTTVMISCSGCKYQSRHYIPKDSEITLEIRQREPGRFPRIVPSRVVWVQRPRSYRELFHVAVEFQIPGNVWTIDSQPEDWFPCTEDEELVVPVAEEPLAGQSAAAASEENPAKAAATSAGAQSAVASARVTSKLGAGNVVSISADHAPSREAPSASVVQKPGAAAAAPAAGFPAISQESLHAQVREAIAARLPAALEEKIEALIIRVRDAAVKETLERVAEHTAAKVKELRNASASAEVLDAKIREVVQQALHSKESEVRKAPARRRKKILK